eukprot:scaffold67815_cov66-Phaeocystis_antarctica.AAC.1
MAVLRSPGGLRTLGLGLGSGLRLGSGSGRSRDARTVRDAAARLDRPGQGSGSGLYRIRRRLRRRLSVRASARVQSRLGRPAAG